MKHVIITVNWIYYKVIYEFYLAECEKLRGKGVITGKLRRQAKENTAQEYNISEAYVFRIVKRLKEG